MTRSRAEPARRTRQLGVGTATHLSGTREPVGGWTLARSAPGDDLPDEGWLPAVVPGGVADALRAAGAEIPDLDAFDWWFRSRLDVEPPAAGERLQLVLEGLTPPAQVLLDGEIVAEIDSMHLPVFVPLTGPVEVAVRCAALGPVLATPRRPRARWRTRVADGGLRFVRTSLLGRAPGFAPGPPLVGPWRPVVLQRDVGLAIDDLRLTPTLDGTTGRLGAVVRFTSLDGTPATTVRLHAADLSAALQQDESGCWTGTLTIPDVARWWPHTHGQPVLHDVRLTVEGHVLDAGRVGFRSLVNAATDVEVDGLDLQVNGVRVFARGVVWTRPAGSASPVDLRALLTTLRDAGANLLRVPGTGPYETAEFADLCDELGILLWQDVALANFDYPAADPGFVASLTAEVEHVLAGLSWRPCFAVLCGGSEVEQQAAMTGLPADKIRSPLTAELLPKLLADSGADAVWVPSSPCGGDLPFRVGTGIAHWFGVGGYRRPLSDVRLAGVRFASECLALANLPAPGLLDEPALLAGAGVPRDVGAHWDFADVRDHYLTELYGVDADELRATDPQRYLQLSREVPGQLMAHVYGEWRRAASPCRGGLVLWACDQQAGAGWGMLDSAGRVKPALAPLARAWSPVAVWLTDEGLDGVDVHVANDRGTPLAAVLDVSLYRDGVRVEQVLREVDVCRHETTRFGIEELLGRFTDVSYAYNFGPPAVDLVVASLQRRSGAADQPGVLLSQAFSYPAGRPSVTSKADELGVRVTVEPTSDGLAVLIGAQAHLHAVRLVAPGWTASDDGFDVAPGHQHRVLLRGGRAHAMVGAMSVRAVNLDGAVEVTA